MEECKRITFLTDEPIYFCKMNLVVAKKEAIYRRMLENSTSQLSSDSDQ